MPNEEIHSENITISSVEDTGQQIKIRDQNRRIYSFFKSKKDGGDTEAYKSYQQYKIGDNVMVTFKEVPYKDGVIKNIMLFKPATGQPEEKASVTPAAQWRARTSAGGGRPGLEYWEKREAKRQSSILMQVAFKSAAALEASRVRAGQNEDRERLYHDTLEFYDWMESQIGEENSKTESAAKEAVRQKSQAETRDDDFFF